MDLPPRVKVAVSGDMLHLSTTFFVKKFEKRLTEKLQEIEGVDPDRNQYIGTYNISVYKMHAAEWKTDSILKNVLECVDSVCGVRSEVVYDDEESKEYS